GGPPPGRCSGKILVAPAPAPPPGGGRRDPRLDRLSHRREVARRHQLDGIVRNSEDRRKAAQQLGIVVPDETEALAVAAKRAEALGAVGVAGAERAEECHAPLANASARPETPPNGRIG